MEAEPPKCKRRWFQFRLRTLLAVVAIVAVQCAVCLPMLREWRAAREWDRIKPRLLVMPMIQPWTQEPSAPPETSNVPSKNPFDDLGGQQRGHSTNGT
jgi:hypothetical protein